MKVLRMLLVICLSLSVPATALAAVVSEAQCEHRHAVADSASTDHAHSMHAEQQSGDHSQHLDHGDASQQSDSGKCSHCSSGHCASGSAGSAVTGCFEVCSVKPDADLIIYAGGQTAVAHSLGLYRPPSLA